MDPIQAKFTKEDSTWRVHCPECDSLTLSVEKPGIVTVMKSTDELTCPNGHTYWAVWGEFYKAGEAWDEKTSPEDMAEALALHKELQDSTEVF